MTRGREVKAVVGKVAKWWAVNWTLFVKATGHPADRLVGPSPWDKR